MSKALQFIGLQIVMASLLLFVPITGNSQNTTFQDVYTILQTNCAGTSCHGGSSPQANLDFSGTMNDVYSALVNKDPVNPAAWNKGDKLVDPGYPEKSFLLRKIARLDWDSYYGDLEVAEGNQMPQNAPLLAKKDIELVRQWILYGAPTNKTVVDPQLLSDYYNGQGKQKLNQPDPPGVGTGFQIRLGSFFLAPQEEREFFKKQKLELPDDVEVTQIDLLFNDLESHHFILYKFQAGSDVGTAEGLRDVNDAGSSNMFNNEIVAAWQNIVPLELPQKTAYFWGKNDVLDLNYHLVNFHLDSIVAADVYLNVYTQPKGTAEQEMKSILLPIDVFDLFFGGELGENLVIPNDGQVHTFTDIFWSPILSNFMDPEWHLWLLSSHTHATGVDYDIYKRNPNGSRGEQLFEGFFDFDYTFNQGYYDWEHPPVRFFDYDMKIDITADGLIHEAQYINNGSDTLWWGNTTKDEMMLIFVQYTNKAFADPVGVEEIAANQPFEFTVAPNPYNHKTYVRYQLESKSDVHLEVFNLLGESAAVLTSGDQVQGEYSYTFSAESLGLSKGVYLVRLTIDGEARTKKIIETN